MEICASLYTCGIVRYAGLTRGGVNIDLRMRDVLIAVEVAR